MFVDILEDIAGCIVLYDFAYTPLLKSSLLKSSSSLKVAPIFIIFFPRGGGNRNSQVQKTQAKRAFFELVNCLAPERPGSPALIGFPEPPALTGQKKKSGRRAKILLESRSPLKVGSLKVAPP